MTKKERIVSMKTLKDLADFIKENKKFITQVHGAFGFRFRV